MCIWGMCVCAFSKYAYIFIYILNILHLPSLDPSPNSLSTLLYLLCVNYINGFPHGSGFRLGSDNGRSISRKSESSKKERSGYLFF